MQIFIIALLQKPDLVISNGPGTALPVIYSVFIIKFPLLIHYKSRIIYIESFCRTKSLSLTGKLVYPIANRFFV